MKTVFVLAMIIATLLGVELEPKKHYKGGLKLSAQRLGVRFYLPPSWSGTTKEPNAFIMTHNTKFGSITAERANIDTVASQMSLEQTFGKDIKLKPISKLKRITRTLYRINYQGRGMHRNYQGIGYVVIGPQNRVVKVMSVFKEDDYTMMDNITMRFVHSISFTAI